MRQDYFRQRPSEWKFWIAVLVIFLLLGLVGGMEIRNMELKQHIQNEIN